MVRPLPVVWCDVADVLWPSVAGLIEALVATAFLAPPAHAPPAVPLDAWGHMAQPLGVKPQPRHSHFRRPVNTSSASHPPHLMPLLGS
jgi:hypothetical protein